MLSLITQPPTQFNQVRDGDRTHEPKWHKVYFFMCVCVCVAVPVSLVTLCFS